MSQPLMNNWLFWIATLAIITGFTLTIMSLLELCTTACVEGHKYKLFGIKFEYFGLVFFTTMLAVHVLGLRSALFHMLAALVVAGGVGGEFYFIYMQKVVIGSWCPICLSIAAMVGITALMYIINQFIGFQKANEEGGNMSGFGRSFVAITTVIFGCFMAFSGTSKADPLQEEQTSIKESIAFGTNKSPIEVYVFTDWFCPACRLVEPIFEKMAPAVQKEGKLYFIDAYIHDESMNYSPYNLSFMIYQKPKYFQLRNALLALTDKTKSPSEKQVETAIAPLGVEYKEVNYKDISLATKMFQKLKRQFDITGTPTVIVVNLDTKKGKKLSGTTDITEANVLKAIEDLKEKK